MARVKKSNRKDGRYVLKRKIGSTIDFKPIYRYFYGQDYNDAYKRFLAYLDGQEQEKKKQQDLMFNEWMDEWLKRYKEGQVKYNTYVSTYVRPCRNQIAPFFKNKLIRDIKPVHIQEFFNKKKNLSISTLDKCRICLLNIFDTALDNGYIDKSPMRHIKITSNQEKQNKRVYSDGTVEYIYENCQVEERIYFLILCKMGLRCSELCGLKWDKIDLQNKTIKIEESLVSEGGKKFKSPTKSLSSKRILPIEDERIYEWLEQNKQGKGYIVRTASGVEMTPNRFSRTILKRVYDSIELEQDKRLTPHELRHTCGTNLYNKTKDIYRVSKYLGHSDIGITSKIYVHSEYHQNTNTIEIEQRKK